MVAITVILAAVIAAFVFGMGSTLKKTYTVAATASHTQTTQLAVTYAGGPDADFVTNLNISVNDVKITSGGIAGSWPTWSTPVSVSSSVS